MNVQTIETLQREGKLDALILVDVRSPAEFQSIHATGAINIPLDEFTEKRKDISDTDFDIMKNLLSHVNDKSFFLFTLHDKNHLELVGMQKMNVMNFGMDIEKIKNDHVYAMIMDKAK